MHLNGVSGIKYRDIISMLWNKLYIMLLISGITILAETFVFHSIGKTYTHKHTHML